MSARKLMASIALTTALVGGCKGGPTTANKPVATASKAGAVSGGKAATGAKLVVRAAEVGPSEGLVAWLFGPLEGTTGSALGTASAVSADGSFSFPTLAAGTYHLQVGHTWSTPKTTDAADGVSLRLLDYPCKITGGAAPTRKDVSAETSALVVVDARGAASLPTGLAVTGEPFSLDWDTRSFVPKDGEKLSNRVRVEFNVVGHPAAHEVKVTVRSGADGQGAEVYSAKTVGGRVLWSGVTPGSYSYRVTSQLISSKVLESPWQTFTVEAP